MTKPENCGTGFCSCVECVVDGLLAPPEGVNTMSATTATNTPQQAMTLADIDLVAKILKNQPPEPIGEWMRNQGRPPEKYRIVFPEKMRDEIQGPMFWPQYVWFSQALEQPIFILRDDAPFEFGKMTPIDWATPQEGKP